MLNRFFRYLQIHLTFQSRRAGFYRDLGLAIKNTDNLKRYLTDNRDHLIKHKQLGQAKLYDEMIENLNSGNGSLEAMMNDLVPDSDMLTLSAIDQGRNDNEKNDGLQRLSKSITLVRDLKKIVKTSVSVLGVVMPVIFIGLLLVAKKLVPQYEQSLSHDHWSSLGKSLYWVSYVATNWAIPLMVGGALSAYYLFKSFSHWAGRGRSVFEKKIYVLRIPYLIYRDYVCSSFLIALSSLLRADISLGRALSRLRDSATPYLQSHIDQIINNLKNNPKNISDAFDTGLIAPDLHLRLSNLTRTQKGIESALIELSDNGFEFVKEEVEKTSAYLKTLATILAAISILYIYGANVTISYDIGEYRSTHINSFK